MEKVARGTLVARVVADLSHLSLQSEDGAYLGSEDDLLGQLGVSRPTLRQAAKIAESERMISVRRGIRGGFYAERPDVQDSIRAINRFLRLSGVRLQDMAVTSSVSCEAAELAAGCTDAAAREGLVRMLAEIETHQTGRSFREYDTRFVSHLAKMSGNPVIEVIVAMSYSFGLDEHGIAIYADPSQRDEARKLFKAMGTAVLDNDGALARFMMERRVKCIQNWIAAADPSQFGPVRQFET